MNDEISIIWPVIRDLNLPYTPAGYAIVQAGLRQAVTQLYDSDEQRMQGSRHVSGQELCFGVRDFALKQYGPMAKTVLETCGIRRTEDIGTMVFAMVEAGLLRMSDGDTPDDFVGVFDFAEAFGTELDQASPAA